MSTSNSLYALGESAYARREYHAAVDYFLQETRNNPGWLRPWMSLGMILLAQGRFDECRYYMEQALHDNPHSPMLHMLLADSHLNLDEYELANQNYLRTMELLDSGNSETGHLDPAAVRLQVHRSLGDCCMMLEQDDEAIKHFQHAIELGDNGAELQHKLTLIYIENTRFDEAEVILEKLLANDPENPTSHQLSGYLTGCQRHNEALNEALEELQLYKDRFELAENVFKRLDKGSDRIMRRLHPRSGAVAGVGRIVKDSQKEFQKALRRMERENSVDAGELAEELIHSLMPHFKTHDELLEEVQNDVRTAVGSCWQMMGEDSRRLLIQAFYLEERYAQARFSSGLTGIQYCFVLEREIKRHLFAPFRESFLQNRPRKRESFKIMAFYLEDRINLSLGQMASVLTALQDSNPNILSPAMESFRSFVKAHLKNGLQLINSDFPRQVNDLAINYRNCWAHGEDLHPEAARECRAIVLGEPGVQAGLLEVFLCEITIPAGKEL